MCSLRQLMAPRNRIYLPSYVIANTHPLRCWRCDVCWRAQHQTEANSNSKTGSCVPLWVQLDTQRSISSRYQPASPSTIWQAPPLAIQQTNTCFHLPQPPPTKHCAFTIRVTGSYQQARTSKALSLRIQWVILRWPMVLISCVMLILALLNWQGDRWRAWLVACDVLALEQHSYTMDEGTLLGAKWWVVLLCLLVDVS